MNGQIVPTQVRKIEEILNNFVRDKSTIQTFNFQEQTMMTYADQYKGSLKPHFLQVILRMRRIEESLLY